MTKQADDAQARVPEYWIVDPEQSCVTVLFLDDADYRVHGQFLEGSVAGSAFLSKFTVDVSNLFASA